MALHFELCLFEFVYLLEHLFEHIAVSRTEVLSSRGVGDCFQSILVDFGFHNGGGITVGVGNRDAAVGTNAYGVDAYSVLAGYLGGCGGCHVAGVVGTVCYEDDALGLGFALKQTVD